MANLAEIQAAARAKKLAEQAEQLKKEGFLSDSRQEVPTIDESNSNQQTIITPSFLNQIAKIPNLIEAQDNEQEHVLLYGAPKTGKTLQAALLSEFYEILWFDGDKGLKSAMNILPVEMQKRIHVIKTPDNTYAPMYWNTILKVVTGRKINICIEHGYVECAICKTQKKTIVEVCLNDLPPTWIAVEDSITQFVSSAIAAINRKNAKTIEGDTNDEFKFTFDEWGNLRQITEKHGNYIKDLKCKFIGISHEMQTAQEDNSKKLVAVGGSEAGSSQFARYFASCVYCKVVNGKHNYITGSTYSGQVQTGTRSNIALEKEAIPSLIHIFNPQNAKELLKGSWNEWFFKKEEDKNKLPQPKVKELIQT